MQLVSQQDGRSCHEKLMMAGADVSNFGVGDSSACACAVLCCAFFHRMRTCPSGC
jgi:hypothetical protein